MNSTVGDQINYNNILVGILTYNNGINLKRILDKIPAEFPFDIVVHVDGSTDDSDKVLDECSFKTLKQPINSGIGSSIRNVVEYAIRHNYKAIAVMPGNNKNDPNEIFRLVEPVIKYHADYVQGSRYLPGSRRDHTPLFRLIMVKIHAYFLSVITFRKITDALEGFRCIKLSVFKDPDINIHQDWLNTYGLETYLFYKVAKNKRFKYYEVPVSKVYPKNRKSLVNKKGTKYSHIRPFIDWWQILRPIFFLMFHIKK